MGPSNSRNLRTLGVDLRLHPWGPLTIGAGELFLPEASFLQPTRHEYGFDLHGNVWGVGQRRAPSSARPALRSLLNLIRYRET
jgi:hypothetical protein